MRFSNALQPALRWHAIISRAEQQPSGLRFTTFLLNWPCAVEPYRRENSLRDAFENATHILSGPFYAGKLLQAGDKIERLVGPDGIDYVRPSKPWSIVGRRHYHGTSAQDHITVFAIEPI